MKTTLTEINAVTGVQGSFFCDKQGEVLACAAPASLDTSALQGIGRQVALTLTALETAGETMNELDFTYEGARLVARVLVNAVLVVMCEPQVEIALLRLTLNVATVRMKGNGAIQSQLQARVSTTPLAIAIRESSGLMSIS